MDVLKLCIITVKDSNFWDFSDLGVYFMHQYIDMVIACDLLILSGFEIDKWTAK